MGRFEKLIVLALGLVLGVALVKALDTPAVAQSAGVPTIASSADGSRAWVGLPGGHVAACELNASGTQVYCATS